MLLLKEENCSQANKGLYGFELGNTNKSLSKQVVDVLLHLMSNLPIRASVLIRETFCPVSISLRYLEKSPLMSANSTWESLEFATILIECYIWGCRQYMKG